MSDAGKEESLCNVDHLQKVMKAFCYTKHCNLKDLRIASMCLICYSCFLRFSELVNLRRSDITFFPTYIKLFLVKDKTDVYREGRDVLIAKTGLPTCPRVLQPSKLMRPTDAINYLIYCTP
jgi:integrase